jgi:hypothetical protein
MLGQLAGVPRPAQAIGEGREGCEPPGADLFDDALLGRGGGRLFRHRSALAVHQFVGKCAAPFSLRETARQPDSSAYLHAQNAVYYRESGTEKDKPIQVQATSLAEKNAVEILTTRLLQSVRESVERGS